MCLPIPLEENMGKRKPAQSKKSKIRRILTVLDWLADHIGVVESGSQLQWPVTVAFRQLQEILQTEYRENPTCLGLLISEGKKALKRKTKKPQKRPQ